MTRSTVYLDHAAATPVDADVFSVMKPYYTEKFYNPSALYLDAKAVSQDITKARQSVAKQLGARPNEIVFTAGGTEANNLAIHGVMSQYQDGNIVISAGEHDSVLKPAAQYECRQLPLIATGEIAFEQLASLIDDNTVLLSIMYANNETGVVQPLARITRLAQQIRHERLLVGNTRPLYVHTDACQAANYLVLNKSRLGIDLMTLNGGKIYGPKQSGCLFVAAHVRLQPQILGGGQERGLRSGTENVANIAGFAYALDKAQKLRSAEVERLTKLRAYACQQLYESVPGIILTGSLQEQTSTKDTAEIMRKHPTALSDSQPHVLPNFVHVHIPGQDNERLIMELDEQGIMAAAGSACSASNDEPSHVLMAMGLSEADTQSSLRVTLGRTTTKTHIDRLVKVLSTLVS